MCRRSFSRPLGEQRYRTLVVIVAEGSKTEIEYFNMFNNERSVIRVKCMPGKHSAPEHVLKEMRAYLAKKGLRSTDEAWLVVDKDRWDEKQLRLLFQWSDQQDNYGLAVSNPLFEYWLLLHFEDGTSISTKQQCITRLRRYLPDYDKDIKTGKIMPGIRQAVDRARKRDIPRTVDWPHQVGTTVYRLVEKLISG